MVDISKVKNDQKLMLWEQLKSARAVMLGSPIHLDHMQPMAPNASPDENAVWFFTKSDSELAKVAAAGGDVHLCLISAEQDYHACLLGELKTLRSQPHINKYWSAVVAAWFPEGKESETVTLLRFTPRDAQFWASSGSTLNFAWQIAKANVTGHEPDVGFSARMKLP